MAAYRSGIKTIIIPEDNVADLDEVDDVVKAAIRFVPAKHVHTVLETALTRHSSVPPRLSDERGPIPELDYIEEPTEAAIQQ